MSESLCACPRRVEDGSVVLDLAQHTDCPIHGTGRAFREGDRCDECGYWCWKRDGEGWHSLVPRTFADTPELATPTLCPTCADKL